MRRPEGTLIDNNVPRNAICSFIYNVNKIFYIKTYFISKEYRLFGSSVLLVNITQLEREINKHYTSIQIHDFATIMNQKLLHFEFK